MSEVWMVSFRVHAEPKAQPRPRAFSRGGHARVYNPDTADGWKAAVTSAGASKQPKHPYEGAMSVRLIFYMPRPQRLSRKCDPNGALPCTAKPDVDNLAKSTIDAMTDAGWWNDDAQLAELHVLKFYAAKDAKPGALVEVHPFPMWPLEV